MKSRSLWSAVAAVALIAVVVAAGLVVVRSRASGSGATLPLARVTESPSPSSDAAHRQPPPAPQRWSVAKATGPVTAYVRPSTSAPVKAKFAKSTIHGYPSIFLVRHTRDLPGGVWYDVWLPIRPNGSHGWIREGAVAIYSTTARIVVDLSSHTLSVYLRGTLKDTFPVATGTAQLPTPTGYFYMNQKLRPPSPGGPYGVLALGISAYQMKLAASAWPEEGPIAIHGTNEDALIGKSISHGCVRMHNADVLKVSDWVPAGSPVVIKR